MGMSSIGPANYAASIAGASSADRVVHRDRKKHPEPTDARRADRMTARAALFDQCLPGIARLNRA